MTATKNLRTLGGLIVAAAFITKHLIDKSGLIPDWAYIIAYAVAIVLLAASLAMRFKNKL